MSPNATAEHSRLLNATCHDFKHDVRTIANNVCIMDYGHRHQWMAFFDINEFLVFTQPYAQGVDDLRLMLRSYEDRGGLLISARMFGSGETEVCAE